MAEIGLNFEDISSELRSLTLRNLPQFCLIWMKADQTTLFHIASMNENLQIINQQFTYKTVPVGGFVHFKSDI